MKKSLLLGFGIACATALPGGPVAADDRDHGSWSDQPAIVGTWQVEFTLRVNAEDCTTAPLIPYPPNPFPALNTFHAGGTVSETGSRSPPSMRSPGHGVWQRTGGRTYESRTTFQGFDANGFLATNMDIRSDITVSRDGNSFKAIAHLLYGDIGASPMPFCATLEGVRFSL